MTSLKPIHLMPDVGPEADTLANKHYGTLTSLVNAIGSPLHVVFPQAFERNCQELRDVADSHGIPLNVAFAHKCNKAATFATLIARNNMMSDVASLGELRRSLAMGVPAHRIEAGGPKSDDYLEVALLHGTQLNIDSIDELRRATMLAQHLPLHNRVPVLARMADLTVSRTTKFGIHPTEVAELINLVNDNPSFQIQGLSFHLFNPDTQQRVDNLVQCLRLFDQMWKAGHKPTVIDIGGHFAHPYLAYPSQAKEFKSALIETLGTDASYGWAGHQFGISRNGQQLVGVDDLPPLDRTTTGAQDLNDFLSAEIKNGMTVASALRDASLTLQIEPGRSVMHQCGLTAALVTNVKQEPGGEWLVGTSINRSSLTGPLGEYYPDPQLITAAQSDAPTAQYDGSFFVTGNLCHPRDVLQMRRLFADRLPRPGDVVVWHNTATYYMDFSESQTSQQPIGTKIAVWFASDGSLRWSLDEQFLQSTTNSMQN
jgi:diaminopimelate decarboxylase